MLTDIQGRPLKAGLDGWTDFKLIPASNAHEVRGLEEIAAMVTAGAMAGDTPVFYATRTDVGGGYPDVRVAVPLTVEELHAYQQGDKSVARDILEALEGQLEEFLEDVKANRIE